MSVQTSPSSERPLYDFELYLHNVLDQLDPLSRVVTPAICMQSKEGANLPRQARDRSCRTVDGDSSRSCQRTEASTLCPYCTVKATNSAMFSSSKAGTTMYCWLPAMYVIGNPVVGPPGS